MPQSASTISLGKGSSKEGGEEERKEDPTIEVPESVSALKLTQNLKLCDGPWGLNTRLMMVLLPPALLPSLPHLLLAFPHHGTPPPNLSSSLTHQSAIWQSRWPLDNPCTWQNCTPLFHRALIQRMAQLLSAFSCSLRRRFCNPNFRQHCLIVCLQKYTPAITSAQNSNSVLYTVLWR